MVICPFGGREKKRKKLPGDEGHVHGEHQVQLGFGMHERGVNAGEGTASGKNVGHDWSIFSGSILRRFVLRKPGGVADDRHLAADRGHDGERAVQECLAAKIQKGFILTHARTLASGEEKTHARQCFVCHMEKHKA